MQTPLLRRLSISYAVFTLSKAKSSLWPRGREGSGACSLSFLALSLAQDTLALWFPWSPWNLPRSFALQDFCICCSFYLELFPQLNSMALFPSSVLSLLRSRLSIEPHPAFYLTGTLLPRLVSLTPSTSLHSPYPLTRLFAWEHIFFISWLKCQFHKKQGFVCSLITAMDPVSGT